MSQESLLIYKSSAGSGKTFTLVKEYLKLVIANPFDYKSTLAMTFTNATMREMKEKVIDELLSISGGKETDTRETLEREFEEEGIEVDVKRNAERVLDLIIHNYSKFSIMTIDSFFSRVIRTFARELRLPMRYDIDLENDKALDSSLNMIYEGLRANGDTKRWLENFAVSRLEDDKGWNIDFNIKKLGSELFNDNFKNLFQKGVKLEDLDALIVKLKAELSKMRGDIKGIGVNAIGLIKDHGLQMNSFKGGSRSFVYHFQKAVEGDIWDKDISQTFRNAIDDQKVWYTKTSPQKDDIVEVLNAGLQSFAMDLVNIYDQKIYHYVSINAVLKNIYSYGLLELLDKELINYRTQHNLMLLSDSGALLKDIISDQDAPFIYEKFGNYFKHILIDEFQDTSNFQWNNLLPLIKNSISDLHKVLVVGDVKQSIYRWRGGDMQLLLKDVYEDLSIYKALMADRVLDTNWRSAKNVVEFNNSVFKISSKIVAGAVGLPEQGELIMKAYDSVEQKPHHTDPPGFVEVKFFANGKGDTEGWKAEAMKELTYRINKCIKDGFSPGDIMLLVEKNSEAIELSEHLVEAGYKIVTESSLLIKNSAIVQFLINALGWLSDPKDNIALAGLYWQHSQLMKKKARLEMFHREKIQGTLNGYFEDTENNSLRELAKKPLYELVEELLRIYNLKKEADPFIMRFLELCLEQAHRGVVTTHDFLNWWDDHKDKEAIVTPEDNEAIRIMTIHKSKGLEAPVVMMPFAAFAFRSKGIFWTSELEGEFKEFGVLPLEFSSKLSNSYFEKAYYSELMEGYIDNLNKTYVAFTRAKNRLYIFSKQFNKEGKYPESLNKLLLDVLTHSEFGYEECWNEEFWEFKLGVEELFLKDGLKPPDSSLHFDIDGGTAYSDFVIIRNDSRDIFKLGDGEAASKIKHGTLLHRILEETLSKNDLERVIDEFINDGIIEESKRTEYAAPILTLFENPLFQSWYDKDWEVMSERSIFSEGSIYKPDRVLLKGNEAVIIDYKHEIEDKKYEKQVSQYASLLSKMGSVNIEKYLVFAESAKIVKVD